MHFPPCFGFPPYFRQIFWLFQKFSTFHLFPKNFSVFIRQKFWWPFCLVIDQKFRISPYFLHFPLFGGNFTFPPTFNNFIPSFIKITCFLHTFCVFRFPPTFTMMHLCITQCTYWTPLSNWTQTLFVMCRKCFHFDNRQRENHSRDIFSMACQKIGLRIIRVEIIESENIFVDNHTITVFISHFIIALAEAETYILRGNVVVSPENIISYKLWVM